MKRIKPKAGQESVWDYPRPPRIERTSHEIVIEYNGQTIARTNKAIRYLETSHPPTYYIPHEDVAEEFLIEKPGKRSFCEWKGRAVYWDLRVGDRRITDAAWSYPEPSRRFMEIADYLAFYPGKMDACYVDGERVQAQEGDFYGGWITSKVVGPFKGGPGTWGW